jgi:UDP-glucuronate decarboxylase
MEQTNLVGPVNIGNPGEFTILELAEMVIQKTGSRSKITMHPLPGDDPLKRQPDISVAKEKLQWEPKIALSAGLDRTIAYFEKLIDSN